ncbi:hypothetical protein [uncultured Clostridium sp.]|uniref:hypothetical protein n=1 Tax=uncultured Clostridium sp. TaxID=59620 RepID=UPI003217E545
MENKSINFIKNRIKNNYCGDMKNNTYDSFKEINPISYLSEYFNGYDLKNNALEYTIKTNDEEIDIAIEYNVDETFEYFTNETVICDGTLIFFNELINKVLSNILQCRTYNKHNAPKDFTNNPSNYKIKYIIGNLVLATEHGDEFSTEKKPWMKSRFTVMLPIKIEYIKKER